MTLPRAEPREGLRQRWIDAAAEVAPNLVALVAGLAHRDFRVGAASGLALACESLWIYRHLCSPQTWAERVMAERTGLESGVAG